MKKCRLTNYVEPASGKPGLGQVVVAAGLQRGLPDAWPGEADVSGCGRTGAEKGKIVWCNGLHALYGILKNNFLAGS